MSIEIDYDELRGVRRQLPIYDQGKAIVIVKRRAMIRIVESASSVEDLKPVLLELIAQWKSG